MTAPATTQTLSQLQQDFAIEGVLAFREKDGLIFADMSTSATTASFCLQGAHLLAWQPAGQGEVLFMSERSDMTPGKPIRGGVPLLFPWFGPRHDGKEGPAHGFARTQTWRLDFAALAGEDVHLTFTLGPTEISRSLGFGDFRLAYQVSLGSSLKMQLVVANDGKEPLTFEEGMHTYFKVSDITKITITGLDGTSYIDKKDGAKVKAQVAGPMPITAPTDRVYNKTKSTCIVHDAGAGRDLVVEKSGSDATVVWNPWADMVDIQRDGWHTFVCVETVNVGTQSVVLEPGKTHTMECRISVEPKGA